MKFTTVETKSKSKSKVKFEKELPKKEKYVPNQLNGKVLVPPEYREWSKLHNHKGKYGMRTLAWCGLTWDSCKDFLHVECGCGSKFIQEKQGGKIEIVE